MSRRTSIVLALLWACLTAVCLPGTAVATQIRVAAASDLKFALDEVVAAFSRETGLAVQPVYGSSGQLTRQIEQGAPFELFLSADEEFVFRLAGRGLTADRGMLYAEGRLALLVPRGSPVAAAADLSGVRSALANGRLTRFAIANPEHAPYGRAAEQALRHAGLWEALQGKLVLGENVSQAAQFAASGNAGAGLIAYSLALAPTFRDRGDWVLIDATWHRPLRQRMVRLRTASAPASLFYDYLQGAAARQVLARYGFTLPPQR